MKKNSLYYIAAGSILFAVGAYGVFSLDVFWTSVLLFLGASIICIPASIPISLCRDTLAANSAVIHEQIYHEPVFLARLFLSMSWIARNCGILALDEFMTDKEYRNTLYHMGKKMIIDGMDSEFVRETLENVITLAKEHSDVKVCYLRQIGREFFFVGVSAGVSGICICGLRRLFTTEIAASPFCMILILMAICFMLGTLFFLLIPGKIQSNSYQSEDNQRQMIQGLLSLQKGDSYTAILHKQYTFLSVEEKDMLYEEPMFAEVKELNRGGNYDGTVADIRTTIKDLGLC